MKQTQLFLVGIMLILCSCGERSIQEKITTPEQAIEALRSGNRRFMEGKSIHGRGESLAEIKQLANHQSPYAAVISCSDSRVPVELIFDCGFGDIFVIRTAGNSLYDDATIGSLQYAISHLGVKSIIILGHSNCGAITSIVQSADTIHHQDDGNCELHNMLAKIEEHIPQYKGAQSMLQEAIEANVMAQREQVLSLDQIKELIGSESITVATAIYYLETGEVVFK